MDFTGLSKLHSWHNMDNYNNFRKAGEPVQVRAKRKNTRMHATAHITVAVAEAMIAALKKAIAENRE